MRRCAFLTMDSLQGFVSDDELAYPPLRRLGWQVEAVSWRRSDIDWGRFDAVVIRSTWDYQQAPESFLQALEQIDRAGTRLENSLQIVRWNLKKTYLADMERRGIVIVPTVWGNELGPVQEVVIREILGTDEVVLKPVVSANADHTYRLSRDSASWSEAAAAFAQREYLAQPFLASIVEEGEYSLFFFGGQFSHAILKTPKLDDFRVQEEHGGIITAVGATSELVGAGERVMAELGGVPLYARADLARLESGELALMELELIEPALYFRMAEGSAERFALALDQRLRSKRGQD
jgi:hypothetical protein